MPPDSNNPNPQANSPTNPAAPSRRAWLQFWETLPQGDLLFAPESQEYVRNVIRDVGLDPAQNLLDFGCGYGVAAREFAPRVKALWFWDAAATMRAAAAKTLSNTPNAHEWDERDPTTMFDLILVNSVIQYMTPDELLGWLKRFRAQLNPGGRAVISDVSIAGHSSLSDIFSLATFSLRKGYFIEAARKTLAERGRYNQTTGAEPLYHPARQELEQMSRAAGLKLDYLPRNLTHFRGRKTLVLARERAD